MASQSQAEWARTAVRLPRDVHKEVHEAAKAEDRSFNGQMVALLREGLQARAFRKQIQGVHA